MKGIRTNGNKFLLDFRHNKTRYRITTKIDAKPENQKKAEKLLITIKLDLDRGLFFINNYKHQLMNTESLKSLDAHYEKNQRHVYCSVLIDEQLNKYKSMVDNGNLALSTFINHQYAIKLHLKPYFDDLKLSEVDIITLESFIRKLKFSRKRIGSILTPLRVIMKNSKRQGIINNNPFDEIDESIFAETAVKSNYEREPFSQDEINLILSNCSHSSIKNILQTGFWTGMRIGELFALDWTDIDFISETISITKSVSINGLIKEPKTKAGNRVIEMTPKAKESLLSQFNNTGNDIDKRVFKTPTGKVWNKTDHLGRYWKKILERANVKYRNPYQMRHTFISYMLSIGNNPLILYRIVGHETPEMMYKKYARFIKSSQGKLLKTE